MTMSPDYLASWGYAAFRSGGASGLQDLIDATRRDGEKGFDRAEVEAAAAAFEAVQERCHVSRIKGRVLRGILTGTLPG